MAGFADITLRVEHGGETFDVNVTAEAVVNWEAHFDLPFTKLFGEDAKMTYFYWLAWECVRSSGQVVKAFDAWKKDLTSVSFPEDKPNPKAK